MTALALLRAVRSGDQVKVLRRLSEDRFLGEDYGYLNFACLERDTGLPRQRVRFVCRLLARKGLTEYGRGLFTEDGAPFGSGYRITEAGADIIARLDEAIEREKTNVSS